MSEQSQIKALEQAATVLFNALAPSYQQQLIEMLKVARETNEDVKNYHIITAEICRSLDDRSAEKRYQELLDGIGGG